MERKRYTHKPNQTKPTKNERKKKPTPDNGAYWSREGWWKYTNNRDLKRDSARLTTRLHRKHTSYGLYSFDSYFEKNHIELS